MKEEFKKSCRNARKNIGRTTICEGSTDEMNLEWSKVTNKQDVKNFYHRFFPAYPEQLIEAIIHSLDQKREKLAAKVG